MMTVIELEIKALKQAIDNPISQYPALHKNKQLLLTIKGAGNVFAREMVATICRISSYLTTMANKGVNPIIATQMALTGNFPT
jgi:hypothetical protein